MNSSVSVSFAVSIFVEEVNLYTVIIGPVLSCISPEVSKFMAFIFSDVI